MTRLAYSSSIIASLGVYHARLAHAAYPTICQALPSIVLQSSKSPNLCTTCVVSKSHKIFFSQSSFQASGPLDLICLNVWGPSPVSLMMVIAIMWPFFIISVNTLRSIFFALNLMFFLFLLNFALLLKNNLVIVLNSFKLIREGNFKNWLIIYMIMQLHNVFLVLTLPNKMVVQNVNIGISFRLVEHYYTMLMFLLIFGQMLLKLSCILLTNYPHHNWKINHHFQHFFKRIQIFLCYEFLAACVSLSLIPTPRTNYHLDLNHVCFWDTVKLIKDINVMILFPQNFLYDIT